MSLRYWKTTYQFYRERVAGTIIYDRDKGEARCLVSTRFQREDQLKTSIATYFRFLSDHRLIVFSQPGEKSEGRKKSNEMVRGEEEKNLIETPSPLINVGSMKKECHSFPSGVNLLIPFYRLIYLFFPLTI